MGSRSRLSRCPIYPWVVDPCSSRFGVSSTTNDRGSFTSSRGRGRVAEAVQIHSLCTAIQSSKQ